MDWTEQARAEINRLWTDLQATQMLLMHTATAHWTAGEVERWHGHAVAAVDASVEMSEAERVNMARALDRLAARLRANRRPEN